MQEKKSIIGISGGLVVDANPKLNGYLKAYVNEDYITSVLKTGGVPYILPVVDDIEVMKAQISKLDGIIFSGGVSVDPIEYGEEHLAKMTVPDKRRDAFDLNLAKIAREEKIPTLCICRGHQVTAVSNGGTLWQDITYDPNVILKHDQEANTDLPTHKVLISKESILYEILQKDEVWTNSFHNQAIKKLPQGFKITGISTDGIIEAVEYENPEYFFLSLQWHPEMMAAKNNPDMLKIFQRFIEETKKQEQR
ncbi:MAG: gamma-glutamyl-gamma-aminobutyrate hydrolase family protein [Sulfurospirillaceae bacterium]|nr:gamma-glutamyl-gamma-aminobutyrate hydrolase family protein [Sulfurospirillaceae bacterium]